MEASEITARPSQRRAFAPWFVYLTIIGVILFLYVRGWLFLQSYAGNIAAGLVQVSIPRQKLELPIISSLVLIIAALLFRSKAAKFVNKIPSGLRGLLLPLPFYFFFTFNWRITVLLLVIGALAWVFYAPVARFLRFVLSATGPLQGPIMRYWPVVLYTYLLTRSALPTVVVALGVVVFHSFDAWMEKYFAPVWAYQQTLAAPVIKGIFLTRLTVGMTAPFVFAYSWGLFNPWMDRYTSLFAVLIFLVTYFVMRGPRAARRILIPGLLFSLGIGDLAWADNCSGAGDCYDTVGFNSAALTALFGGLGAVGLSLILDFIPVIGEIKSFNEFRTGRDLITGQKLSWWERLLALLGAIPLIGRLTKLGKVAKAADKLGDLSRAMDKAGDLARAADELGDAARAENKVRDLLRSQGIPAGNARGIQNISDKYGANIKIRPTNTDSLRKLEQGYPPKPSSLHSKSLSHDPKKSDTFRIGASANPEKAGEVGWFHPPHMSPQEFRSLSELEQGRYFERIDEQFKYGDKMDSLEKSDLIKIEDGVIINTGLDPDPKTLGKPFVGDHDIFEITYRNGSEVPEGIKEQIIRDLKEYGVEHGAHMDWYPWRSDFEVAMWRKIINQHTASELGGGGEALIMFGEGDPILIYNTFLAGG